MHPVLAAVRLFTAPVFRAAIAFVHRRARAQLRPIHFPLPLPTLSLSLSPALCLPLCSTSTGTCPSPPLCSHNPASPSAWLAGSCRPSPLLWRLASRGSPLRCVAACSTRSQRRQSWCLAAAAALACGSTEALARTQAGTVWLSSCGAVIRKYPPKDFSRSLPVLPGAFTRRLSAPLRSALPSHLCPCSCTGCSGPRSWSPTASPPSRRCGQRASSSSSPTWRLSSPSSGGTASSPCFKTAPSRACRQSGRTAGSCAASSGWGRRTAVRSARARLPEQLSKHFPSVYVDCLSANVTIADVDQGRQCALMRCLLPVSMIAVGSLFRNIAFDSS